MGRTQNPGSHDMGRNLRFGFYPGSPDSLPAAAPHEPLPCVEGRDGAGEHQHQRQVGVEVCGQDGGHVHVADLLREHSLLPCAMQCQGAGMNGA